VISLHPDTDHLGDEARYWKDFEPVDIGGALDTLARVIKERAWSPIQWWNGGRRKESNFARAGWCVFDFDDGMVSVQQAIRTFQDCIHVIGTTKSHRPDHHRFRVLVPFERPIENAYEFKGNMRYWIGRFGSDDQCVDAARFYWPCKEIMSVAFTGETLEVILPPPPIPPKDFSAYRSAKALPTWAKGVLLTGAPRGKRNSTCYRLGLYLAQCGFDTDEIVGLIQASPIDLPVDEVTRAVVNGVKAGKQILAEQADG
jgi:hypothetical protein